MRKPGPHHAHAKPPRITWVLRSFLDYRVPVFAELDACTNHQLHVVFSTEWSPERVQKKLAASVNILPPMDSIYTWKDELRSGREHKMFIKTTDARLAALETEIKSAHPYAVAEIICFKIDSGEPDYLDWISASTR